MTSLPRAQALPLRQMARRRLRRAEIPLRQGGGHREEPGERVHGELRRQGQPVSERLAGAGLHGGASAVGPLPAAVAAGAAVAPRLAAGAAGEPVAAGKCEEAQAELMAKIGTLADALITGEE